MNRLEVVGFMLLVALPGWPQTLQERAWDILHTGATDASHTDQRQEAVQALGLVGPQPQAVALAEQALKDSKPNVRQAAAQALEKMPSPSSRRKLEPLLSDPDVQVALAAAHALLQMHDDAAYQVYYAVLTGERKASKGVIAEQLSTLQNKKKLAEMGLEEGLGFVPFAGIGLSAYKALRPQDASPVRAAAALALAHDPDPKSAEALTNTLGTGDKDWPLRAAALESLAMRGDAKLISVMEPSLSDAKDPVRYDAAAAILRLLQTKVAPKPAAPPTGKARAKLK